MFYISPHFNDPTYLFLYFREQIHSIALIVEGSYIIFTDSFVFRNLHDKEVTYTTRTIDFYI